MPPTTTVEDLLRAYHAALVVGDPIAPEVLCRDHPELLDELLRRLEPARATEIPRTEHQASADATATRPDEPVSLPELCTDAEPLPGYRLVRRLGKGGFGEVWEALAPGGFRVAFKFVSLEGRAGEIELQALEIIRNLRHPNLLTVFGTWQTGGRLLIGMELADATLADELHKAIEGGGGGVPRRPLMRWSMDTARVIDYLNKPRHFLGGTKPVGIQHGDIKPQNVLLVGQGVKVGDFGLVRLLRAKVERHAGGMTPLYAPPEVLEGRVSRWSDQYSLAVTWCQLRGGRLPFRGENAAEFRLKQKEQKADLTMIPEPERPVVARALSYDPRRRWPDCRAFIKALADCQASTSQEPRAAPRESPGDPQAPLAALSTVPTDQRSTPPMRDPIPARPSLPDAGIDFARIATHIATYAALSLASVLTLAVVVSSFWMLRPPPNTVALQSAEDIQVTVDRSRATKEASAAESRRPAEQYGRSEIKRTAPYVASNETARGMPPEIDFAPAPAGLPPRLAERPTLEGPTPSPASEKPQTPQTSPSPTTANTAKPPLVGRESPENPEIVAGGRTSTEPALTVSPGGAPAIIHRKSTETTTTPPAATSPSRTRADSEIPIPLKLAIVILAALVTIAVGLWVLRAVRRKSGGQLVHRPETGAPDEPDEPPPPEDVALPGEDTYMADLGSARVDSISGSPLKTVPVEYRGHTDAVWAIALAPDGKCVASGGMDHSVRLWDFISFQSLQSFEGHSEGVTAVAFQANGPVIASACLDGALRLWPISGGEDFRRLDGHRGRIFGLASAPGGHTLASCGEDGTIRLWDFETGTQLNRLQGHAGWVYAIAYAGDRLLSAGADGTVRLWDANTGSEVQRLQGHSGAVRCLAVTPDGSLVASGGQDRAVIIWDVANARELRRLVGHRDWVRAVAWTPDGSRVVTGGDDETLCVWDAATGELLKRFEDTGGSVLCLAITPDGRFAFAGSDDANVRRWELSTSKTIQ